MADRRRVTLFSLLALTVLASIWVSDASESAVDDAPAPAVERVATPRRELANKSTAKDRVVLNLDKLQRTRMEVGDLDPFGAKSWYVAPPAPPPAPPSEPTAPPLPFSYLGQMQEADGRWVVYLSKGDQAYVIGKGETFDDVYRLDGVENGNLVIRYLPLSAKQLLPVGGES